MSRSEASYLSITDLLKLLDENIQKDNDFDNRNEALETLILRYLESKGKI